MLRLLFVLFALSVAAPLLAACGEQPQRVPIMHEAGKTKVCPSGRTDC